MSTLTVHAKRLALDIWQEQLDAGIGDPGETAGLEHIDDWVYNRVYPFALLEEAASGDVAAIAEVRMEAGLSLLS